MKLPNFSNYEFYWHLNATPPVVVVSIKNNKVQSLQIQSDGYYKISLVRDDDKVCCVSLSSIIVGMEHCVDPTSFNMANVLPKKSSVLDFSKIAKEAALCAKCQKNDNWKPLYMYCEDNKRLIISTIAYATRKNKEIVEQIYPYLVEKLIEKCRQGNLRCFLSIKQLLRNIAVKEGFKSKKIISYEDKQQYYKELNEI